jgi:ComF family protein
LPWWRHALATLIDLVFPPLCPTCHNRRDKDDQVICAACREAVEPLPRPVCPLCGAPGEKAGGEGRFCDRCPRRPIHFDLARAATRYDGPAAEAAKALKFRRRTELAPVLAGKMVPTLVEDIIRDHGPVDWIVPVPLHFTRKMRRGFNQAVLIGRELSRLIDIPLLEGALARTKRTKQQTLLDTDSRRANVEGAFAVTDPPAVAGQRLVLIDDVLTTGATANACAEVLKEAGAEAVLVLTFARAVRG